MFGHTGEKGEFTFKRNGVYDRKELARINHFLRDWRKKEDARMDPHLLDLVWAIYQKTGSKDYIHVVSAYRSPATNEMLRKRSSGVAKNSQHRLGKAMDWYLTDVPLTKLRATAMKMQGGGVGYYPRSGSPFVHTDTGSVRAWPRMTRQQLIALFPDGNTLHLPADGKPLPGYQLAVAKRNAAGSTALAYLDTGSTEAEDTDRTGTQASSNSWLKRVFRGDGQNDESVANAPPAASPAEDQPQVIAASLQEEEEDLPRPPRSRPIDTAEDTGAEAAMIMASVDATGSSPIPALPRTRPTADAISATEAMAEEDDIASLAERMNQDYPEFPVDPAQPIALAFAAAAESPEPSEADRAILTAFAALTDAGALHDADPTLAAALTRRALGGTLQQPSSPPVQMAVADLSAELRHGTDVEPQPAEPAMAEVITGTILPPAESASYDGDEGALVQLIDSPASTPSEAEGELAMPNPLPGLLVAPAEASEVANLRNQPGPPVERFARSEDAPTEQSFFSRLFASLVE
jgi:uncharacterized protein YcbK (DUF882 family)